MSFVAHRIRRLTWLLRAPSMSSAFTQRQVLRNELETVLLPAMERVFDQYSTNDEVLRISKLTLQISTDVMTVEDLKARIEEQLQRIFSGLVRGPAVRRRFPSDQPENLHPDPQCDTFHNDPEFTPRIEQHRDVNDKLPDAQHLAIVEYRRETLIAYLRSGRIGWQADELNPSTLVEWLQAEAIRLVREDFRASTIIVGTLETRVAMSFRLLHLIPSEICAALVQDIPLPQDELIAAITQSMAQSTISRYWQLRIGAFLFALRVEDLPGFENRNAVKILAAWSWPLAVSRISSDPASPIPERHKARTTEAHGEQIFDRPTTQNEHPTDTMRSPTDISRDGPEVVQRSDASSDRPFSRDDVPKSRASPTGDEDLFWRVRAVEPRAAMDVPGLLAGDAGLILLHPFLPQLFETLGIAATGRGPLSPQALPRAATLLHWLVTGNVVVFEFELTLTKILLGLTPDAPLFVSDGLLSQADFDEGTAVLDAVIEHWSILRDTSVAGLRTSFLQRRGMLRDDELGWRLHMETESFDVLLGQLPWSFNVVKMPWMKKPIITDWPTP